MAGKDAGSERNPNPFKIVIPKQAIVYLAAGEQGLSFPN